VQPIVNYERPIFATTAILGGEMCGIAVAIDWDGAEAAARRLIAGTLHRGDVTDPLVTVGSHIAMCTRRLRIVDAANGAQPLSSFDERFLVCFNGEIYNHVALRRELEALGVHFRTDCDTEVLANVLRVWGQHGLKRLAGMYSFVAVDTATGEFLAARDPFGVKPLYFIRSQNGFLFCSEIQPLLAAAEGDVLFLPPGCVLTRNFCARHYNLPTSVPCVTSIEKLDRLLSEAVGVRIPSDLPIAMLFSGGIDSTLIAHYARRERHDVGGYIAVGNNSPDYDYARRYADATGFDLREVCVELQTNETLSLIEAVVDTVETFEPAVIRSGFYAYLVCQRINQDGYRVALCGEGADELFAGYEPLEQAFVQTNGAGRDMQRQILGLMHRANLQRIDRCSMRFQVEVREPFLDQSLVDYASALDDASLVDRSGRAPVGKVPLRALYDLYPSDLPDFIRDRQKLPFHEGADGVWGHSGWAELFEEAVSDAEFFEGKREFAEFGIATKEELFFARALAAKMDIKRVPHLRGRLWAELQRAA
jgi:asparagine synthase (glutamine-hydrolysing)